MRWPLPSASNHPRRCSPRPPAAPIPIDQTPQFTWNAANFAVSYEFQLDDTSNFSSPLIAPKRRLSHQLHFSPHPAGWQILLARVRHNRYAAAGAASSRYFTIDITPPPAPVLKSPADAASYKGTPTYTWGTATGARTTSSAGVGEGSTSTPRMCSPPPSTNRPPSRGPYIWQVRAGDLAGNWSDWSSTRSLTVIPPIPAAPVLAAPANGLNTSTAPPSWTGTMSITPSAMKSRWLPVPNSARYCKAAT